ncbi:unnamed protein product [Adineta ricciae]|uniref:Uncharacterized protein n=2 Tax=Adineta ricciae TaxID=249248 RepID=A0A814VS01_ADIRI|nr:unnamed protein product [Adineta ricciae]
MLYRCTVHDNTQTQLMSCHPSDSLPTILTIADSYSDCSDGIQIDLQTFTALSTFGMFVTTALIPMENSNTDAIQSVPIEFISSQYRALVNRTKFTALKIGTLHSSSLINCVIPLLVDVQIPILVFDPVVVSNNLSSDTLDILRTQLLPKIRLITPTIEEAAALLQCEIHSFEGMKAAAQNLHHLGAKYVLIRNNNFAGRPSQFTEDGNNRSNFIMDVLFDGMNFTPFKSFHFSGTNRGKYTAAITAFLANGSDIKQAIEDAIAYTGNVSKYVQSESVVDDNSVQEENPYEIGTPHGSLSKSSFIQLLKTQCAQEWFDYTHHRFVQELGRGTLPQASFQHYLIQDYIFLTHFARCYSLIAYKSDTMDEIMLAAKNVCFIGYESKLHTAYCAEWGIDTTKLNTMKEARANLAYTRYTLDVGMTGDLLDLYIALAPCLLGYGDIALRLFEDPTTDHQSPYWKWISNYAANDYQQSCRRGEQLIERLAIEYGVWHAPCRMKKLIDIFRTGTQLEIGFWDMGLHMEW